MCICAPCDMREVVHPRLAKRPHSINKKCVHGMFLRPFTRYVAEAELKQTFGIERQLARKTQYAVHVS
jgi:hypothetical protein